MKYILLMSIFFLISCSGNTYQCFVDNPPSICEYDINKKTIKTELNPYIITRAIAEGQEQINSNITQTVNTTLGVLEVTTHPSIPNAVGRFVGGGTGNKAILQLNQFNTLKLSEINYVSIEYKTIIAGGGNVPYLNLVVDLDCIFDEDVATLTLTQLRARRRVIVWHSLFAGSNSTDADGFTKYESNSNQNGFAIVGTPQLGMSANPVSYQTLSQFDFTSHPNACIVNGVNGDGGLPRNLNNPVCITGAGLPGTTSADCGKNMAGIFVNIGDSMNTSNYSVQIRNIWIKDKTISFREIY